MFSAIVSHGKQGIGLEHHAPVGARALDLAAVEQHSSGARAVEPCDDAQERGLSAAGRAEDGDEVVVARLPGSSAQAPARARRRARPGTSRDTLSIWRIVPLMRASTERATG